MAGYLGHGICCKTLLLRLFTKLREKWTWRWRNSVFNHHGMLCPFMGCIMPIYGHMSIHHPAPARRTTTTEITMTMKTKSTRRTTRPTASGTKHRRGEGWGQMCARVMAEADEAMAMADELLAKLAAHRLAH